jgi:hypothetical protein
VKTRTKVLLITLLFGGAAFALGPVIWPPNPHNPVPNAAQLPFLIVLSALEALTFGLGVAFVAFGLPLVRRLARGSPAFTWTMFVGIAWLMLSWWPHDKMHLHNGLELNGLIAIEYTFHASLMVTAVVLAYTFVRSIQAAQAEGSAEQPIRLRQQGRSVERS